VAAAERQGCAGALLVAVALVAGGCAATDGEGGGPARRAIVNGEPDTVHRAVAALVYQGSVFCTGTVIAPRAVLTAAHCLARGNRPPAEVQAFFGDDWAAGGPSVAVTEGFLHPDYYMNDARGAPMNDVAVLVLAADAPEAPLPWQRAPLPEVHGEAVTLVGYGITAPGTTDGLGVRRRVGQTIIALDETFYYYSGDADGTCQGDSGGPMLLDVGGVPVVIGVTSFGDDTCVEFGANTRLDRFAGFVAAHVEGGPAAPTQPIALAFVTPRDGDRVGGTFTVAVDARSRAGIAEVEVEVDGVVRASREVDPWELGLYGLAPGEHEVVARARGADDGLATASVHVTVTKDGLPPDEDKGVSGGCRASGGGAAAPPVLLLALLLAAPGAVAAGATTWPPRRGRARRSRTPRGQLK
jgi:hypothetical protein